MDIKKTKREFDAIINEFYLKDGIRTDNEIEDLWESYYKLISPVLNKLLEVQKILKD